MVAFKGVEEKRCTHIHIHISDALALKIYMFQSVRRITSSKLEIMLVYVFQFQYDNNNLPVAASTKLKIKFAPKTMHSTCENLQKTYQAKFVCLVELRCFTNFCFQFFRLWLFVAFCLFIHVIHSFFVQFPDVRGNVFADYN